MEECYKPENGSNTDPIHRPNSSSELSDSRNEQKSGDSKGNEHSETSFVDSSTENPNGTESATNAQQDQEGNSTQLPIIDNREFLAFLKRLDQDKVFYCRCNCDEGTLVVLKQNSSQDVSSRSLECKTCNEKVIVNPCWKYRDIKAEIFRFLRYQNPTTTLCHNVNCKADDDADIVPTERDKFGIITKVGCIKCGEDKSLEMTTENKNKLTMITNIDELKPGDELMFRRWYGISHHAIYLGKKEPGQDNNDTNTQHDENSRLNESAESSDMMAFRSGCSLQSSGVLGRVISATFDKEDARVIKGVELVEGLDVYRIEYDSCYHPQWTLGNATTAAEFETKCTGDESKVKPDVSNYDPFMENCEHFSRRCKTGQSESRQVQACLYNCGANIAMLVFRIAFLAIWWVSLAAVDAYEKAISHNATNVTTLIPCLKKIEKMTGMEVAVATSLSILLLIFKIVFSSISESNKLTRRQGTSRDNQKLCTCAKYCYRCCCKCCPKKCYGFRYLFRLLFCLFPIHICQKICCSGYPRCSCKCTQCCDDPFMKSCCRIYVAIAIRVVVTEVIVIGIPIGVVNILLFCYLNVESSVFWAARGFLYALLLVLVLSLIHSCIATLIGRIVGCFCRRCCCCCYCCCGFENYQQL